MTMCQRCGAVVIYRRTANGRYLMLDQHRSEDGNVVQEGEGACRVLTFREREEAVGRGQAMYQLHQQTCPEADLFMN